MITGRLRRWFALGTALVGVALQTHAEGRASFRDCPTCPQMVVLPSGSFVMGASGSGATDTLDAKPDELPRRVIDVTRPFAVSRTEITVAQFRRFVEHTKYRTGRGCRTWVAGKLADIPGASWQKPGFPLREEQPVTCVSWNDAQAFVRWLGSQTRQRYRLLTEAEWEFAARGGASGLYSFGEDVGAICRFGNVADLDAARAYGEMPAGGCRGSRGAAASCRSDVIGVLSERLDVRGAASSVPWEVVRCHDGVGVGAAIVASYAPNGFGLRDTTGNVWEWVQDCYAPRYDARVSDTSAAELDRCEMRVLRGGAWAMNTDGWRAADRDRDRPEVRYAVVGLRVARELD